MTIRYAPAALALLVVSAVTTEAQIIDSRRAGGGEPIAYTSLAVGWLTHGDLCDPDSSSCWDFGGAPQFRATLDMPIGRGATFGLAGTTARVPLIYRGGLATGCAGGCDADATVSQVFANVRIGGGLGLHQVIDLNAGMTIFSNFRELDGDRLGAGSVSSFTFAVGYGFGYPLSPRFHLMLLQDFGLVIHKRMPGQSSNTAQQSVLRLGARYGLGTRGRGF